jgi:hypothetical protein
LSNNLSRKELENDEFVAGIHEMHGVADRAAAIIGGALVEDALVTAISASLQDFEPKGPLFYEAGAPFGTFSNRITVARAMGFLDDKEAADLRVIKNIRNQFAHALLPLRFSNELIIEECEKIGDYEYPDMPEREVVEPSRVKYEMACCGIWILVTRRTTKRRNEQIEEAKRKMGLFGLANLIAPSLKGGG